MSLGSLLQLLLRQHMYTQQSLYLTHLNLLHVFLKKRLHSFLVRLVMNFGLFISTAIFTGNRYYW